MTSDTKHRLARSLADRRAATEMLRVLQSGKDTRWRQVATVRRSLRREAYVNSLKWDVALERLIDSAVEGDRPAGT